MRHSLDEPGTGDPPGYRFGDCATQRQLIPEGRETAWRVGEEFRQRRIQIGEVLSSEWCRARDTAQIAFGRHDVWVPLNVQNPATKPYIDSAAQNTAVTARIAAHAGPDNFVLVTHYLNIMPLLDAGPAKGDAVVIKFDAHRNQLKIVAMLTFD